MTVWLTITPTTHTAHEILDIEGRPMTDLKPGDTVMMTDRTEGRVLSVGSEGLLDKPDGNRVKVELGKVMAYVEVTDGPGAGKPWGFHFVEAEDLERIGSAHA